MDSLNAIYLTPSKTQADEFDYDDYGVKPAHCIPPTVPSFEYHGATVLDVDGERIEGDSRTPLGRAGYDL